MDLLRLASPDELAAAENLYNRLREEKVVDCMNSAGFDYVAADSTVSANLFTELSSLDVARSRGFGVVDAATPIAQPRQDPNGDNPFRDTREYADALESCGTEASQAVQEESGTAQLRAIQADLVSAIEADPDVVEASKAWADCAAGVGYPFQSRRDLIADFVARVSHADPAELSDIKRREIDAAVATFDCSQSFDEVWRTRGQIVAESQFGDLWTLGSTD